MSPRIEVRNGRTNLSLGADICVARSFFARTRGLLGRRSLGEGEGMWIEPAPSIHMFFMRFAIDAIFVDGDRNVVRIFNALQPWRLAFGGSGAVAVLEVPPLTAARTNTEIGDTLVLVTTS